MCARSFACASLCITKCIHTTHVETPPPHTTPPVKRRGLAGPPNNRPNIMIVIIFQSLKCTHTQTRVCSVFCVHTYWFTIIVCGSNISSNFSHLYNVHMCVVCMHVSHCVCIKRDAVLWDCRMEWSAVVVGVAVVNGVGVVLVHSFFPRQFHLLLLLLRRLRAYAIHVLKHANKRHTRAQHLSLQ